MKVSETVMLSLPGFNVGLNGLPLKTDLTIEDYVNKEPGIMMKCL